jgi:phosphatidylglycerophosphate synthase
MPAHRYIAHAITALRLALTPAFVAAAWRAAQAGAAWPAAVIFAAVVLSDLADGRVARRLGAATPRGRVLDHCADIAFLLAALVTYVELGRAPWWVPATIAASFAVYVGDSLTRRAAGAALIGSRAGHVGGVLNYALVGVLVGEQVLAPNAALRALAELWFVAVPVYSAWSIASRLGARRRGRRPARG